MLARFLVTPGSIKYDEGTKLCVNQKILKSHAEMWKALASLQPNLAFKKMMLQNAVAANASARNRAWRLSEEALAQYRVVVTKRLFNMTKARGSMAADVVTAVRFAVLVGVALAAAAADLAAAVAAALAAVAAATAVSAAATVAAP